MSDPHQPAPERDNKRWRVTVVKPRDAAQGETAIHNYNTELIAILRDKNVFQFRNYLAASGRALPDDMMLDTLKMATLMHQMILSLPELSEQHDFSRQWLDDNTVLQSSPRSLNEAAKRAPGAMPDLPPPNPRSRTISLRAISKPPEER